MTCDRGSPAESKNCEILLLLTADRRLDTKVKCPAGRASFWVKFPTERSLTRVKCPGIARGRWAVLELTGTLSRNKQTKLQNKKAEQRDYEIELQKSEAEF